MDRGPQSYMGLWREWTISKLKLYHMRGLWAAMGHWLNALKKQSLQLGCTKALVGGSKDYAGLWRKWVISKLKLSHMRGLWAAIGHWLRVLKMQSWANE